LPVAYGLNSLLKEITTSLAGEEFTQIAGVPSAMQQLAILSLINNKDFPIKNLIIVVPQPKDMSPWLQLLDFNLPLISKTTLASALPGYVNWGNDRFVNQSTTRNQRLYSFNALVEEKSNIVVTTMQGLSQTTLSPEEFKKISLKLKTSQTIDLDDLTQKLIDLGFVEVGSVDEEGAFAIRGGIVDVFPVSVNDPIRIEFFGDEIISIRFFSIETQRSKISIDQISITPCVEADVSSNSRKEDVQKLYNHLLDSNVETSDREGLIDVFRQGVRFGTFDMFAPLFRDGEQSPKSEQKKFTAFDYLDDQTLLFFPQTVEKSLELYKEYFDDAIIACENDAELKRPCLSVDRHFLNLSEAQARIGNLKVLEAGNPHTKNPYSFIRLENKAMLQGIPPANSEPSELFDKWLEIFQTVLKKDVSRVVILAHRTEQVERLNNLMSHRGIVPVHDPKLLDRMLKNALDPGQVFIGKGEICSYLWNDEVETLVIPEAAIFGKSTAKAKPDSKKLQNYLNSFKDLKVGDLVVHVQHGIGKYLGMQEIEAAGMRGDFLILSYHGGDKVYLPVDRLNMLQKYAGSEASSSKALDKLGGQAWEKRKTKVKGAVRDMADELLKQQAKRELAEGFQYAAPSDDYIKFEAAFPYEETQDQLKAIDDVSADFESTKPMDRLICGDVGFGKTEIALRAAYRAVSEGFQVLVLVPTTVLCYQHFKTFQSRLEPFGVRVAQANRFVKPKDLKQALSDLETGKIDILVGTHRILSKDIKPANLGLFVVDEEQRFGVAHKDRLKNLSAGADVLTLTATPIPRTLHMSMLGLRDISIIATPPQDRMSVKTYVAKFDETLIREALKTEIKRGGQVFFVHNRVEDIEEVASFVRSLIPNSEVRVAHGQMKEHQLERQIVDFLEQKYPVLVCTTIIESGIDMPNVNTLIVNRSDRFGLAQLYQLRGRVGRSNRQAYSYFLTPPLDHLSDDAKKRLEVIAAYQDLGSGFQIASHDLEIRGAGNLIGGEQSGHVSEVGLELYTEMLEIAIAELRGEKVRTKTDAELKIPVSGLIPDGYIKNQNQRLHLYKTLFSFDSYDELMAFRQEIEDRYGRLPADFDRLMKIARLKQMLRLCNVFRLSVGAKHYLELQFAKLDDSEVSKMLNVINDQPKKYKLAPNNSLILFVDVPKNPEPEQQEIFLSTIIKLLDPLEEALG